MCIKINSLFKRCVILIYEINFCLRNYIIWSKSYHLKKFWRQSYVASLCSQMTLNSFCLHLPSAGIAGMCYHLLPKVTSFPNPVQVHGIRFHLLLLCSGTAAPPLPYYPQGFACLVIPSALYVYNLPHMECQQTVS